MSYDTARQLCVLFGGMDGATANNETWEWDGSNWLQRLVSGPTARYGHAMFYDPLRSVVVVLGGQVGNTSGPISGDIWEWNGSAWTMRPFTGPFRSAHAVAYDSVRNVVVLFGGIDGSTGGRSSETWEWDGGTTWTRRMVSGPAARSQFGMAFDPVRAKTVLFGGNIDVAGQTVSNDETWEWDGTAWLKRNVVGPSARFGHSLTYETGQNVVMLFGGRRFGDASFSAETWEWNGVAWNQRQDSGPSGRDNHATAYDSARRVTVLFGGTGSQLNGDTWEDNAPCIVPTQPLSVLRCPGDAVTFATSSSGGLSPTYQWRKDGVEISGATASSFTIASPTLADAGGYDCTISNAVCPTVTTNAAALDIYCQCVPTFSQTGGVNDNFSVSNGAEPAAPRGTFSSAAQSFFSITPSLTINFDDVPPGGSSNVRYFFHSFTGLPNSSSSATLTLHLYGSQGSNTPDDTIRLGFAQAAPPSISTFWSRAIGDCFNPPVNWIGGMDRTLTLNLEALPLSPSGTTNLVPQLNSNGFLDLIVENRTQIDYATLSLTNPPSSVYPWIAAQPQSLQACPNSSASFSVTPNAAGAPFTYQWQKDSINIPGATGAVYSIPQVGTSAYGSYRCIVTNACGSTTSNAASLTSGSEWHVVNLHPAGAVSSNAFRCAPGRQSGIVDVGTGHGHASVWSGTAASWVSLHPTASAITISSIGQIDGGIEAGSIYNGQWLAVLWHGTSNIDMLLHPPGATRSTAGAASGGRQGGAAEFSGYDHAVLWSGTSGNWVDIHPPFALSSSVTAMSGTQQVGVASFNFGSRAALWMDTAASYVNLGPSGTNYSAAYGTDGTQQVGYARFGTTDTAGLWEGNAASWVSLAPAGATASIAFDVVGGQQVGEATIAGVHRAGFWRGTAASWTDLHALLPGTFTSSTAHGISRSGLTVTIVGWGYNSATGRNEALMWTATETCCVADVDDGTGTGTPDSGVTIDDLLYYLQIFETGAIDADVDDGTSTGTPDGGVTIDDLLYYLFRFEAGC